jgi:hypothetical protein
MANKTILFGGLVMALVFAFSAAPVLACDGGGEVLFNGNVVVGAFYLTDGFTTVGYNGLVNIGQPYVTPSQINNKTETIYINQLRMKVQSISSYQSTKYLDISGAELTVTGATSYSCDLQFGDVARVNVVTAQACSAFNVPVCDMFSVAATDVAAEAEPETA